jgi:protein ImuB
MARGCGVNTLWLAAHFPALALEALAFGDPAIAVTQARGSRRWVAAAADPRLEAGMDLGLARVRRPELIACERQPGREMEALETLACAAYGCGERIAWRVDEPERDYGLPRHTLWVEIGASLKLFGGIDRLIAKLDEDFLTLGHRAIFAAAPTLEAAAALALAGRASALNDEALYSALQTLPLAALAISADALELLASIGLHRLGEVLALPRDALAARLRREDLTAIAKLSGEQPDPRHGWRPPQRFRRRLDFDHEIEDTERLAFPLRRLVAEFLRYLRARATGVQQFRLELAHRDLPTTSVELRLSAPSRDEAQLLRVLRERLANLPLPAPVRGLVLAAERFANPAAAQRDFFDNRAQTEEEADAVIDRIRARLGTEAVWRPQLVEDHRPERAWRNAAPETPQPQAALPLTPRPLWLLREPQRLDRPPPIAGGVERIESGWWDGGDVRRDYFICELDGGRRGWAYHDRRDGQIWLHGLWAQDQPG